MNTFIWLLLGHLLGDWVLQSGWMARDKRLGIVTWAGTVHFVIYTATILVALWLAHRRPIAPEVFLASGLLIFASHWLIDATGLVRHWMRIYGQGDGESVRLVVDQTLHLLVLGLVAARLPGL